MRVNQDKTQLLCISTAIHDQCTAYIRPTVNGETKETTSKNELKNLGFWFSNRLTVNLHVEKMCASFRSRLWSLRRLRRSGLPSADLVNIYKSVLRPVLEFACVVFGPMLTEEMSTQIERLQLKALKITYGLDVSYSVALETSCLEELKVRRKELLRKFAEKNARNERFRYTWFPLSRPMTRATRGNMLKKKAERTDSTGAPSTR